MVGEHISSYDHKLVRIDIRIQTTVPEDKVMVPNFKTILDRDPTKNNTQTLAR